MAKVTTEQMWEAMLTGNVPRLHRMRRMWGALPSPPRCKLCNAPFSGPGSVLMRMIGYGTSPLNRRLCNWCIRAISKKPGGAEVEIALLFADVRGSTDSEVFFFLARTLGLEDDPPTAVARAVGLIEEVGRRHGVEHPIQMTVATSNGEKLWAFRYSSEGQSRSLFYSTDVVKLRALHPEIGILQTVSDESRLIVSEPLGSVSGAWN